MERLVVEADGRLVIPPEVIHRRGFRPGDELSLVEAAEGLLVYQGDVDAETAVWLSGCLARRAKPGGALFGGGRSTPL